MWRTKYVAVIDYIMKRVIIMDTATLLRRFYDALSCGDIDAATACLSPDARIWHNHDCKTWTVKEAIPTWNELVEQTYERGIADIRVMSSENGCVQQHVFYMRTADGAGTGLPCCIVAQSDNGKLTRLDEYLDMKAAFPIVAGERIVTPGYE